MSLAITTGVGLASPIGTYVRLSPPIVESLANALRGMPQATEAWWSGHLWKENRRRATGWLASVALVVDVDYADDCEPFPEHVGGLQDLVATGNMPGSIFHLTPHGARIVFALAEPCSDRDVIKRASAGCMARVTAAIDGYGYVVDPTCTPDLARLYFTPNSIAKGVARNADVVVLRSEPYDVDDLAAEPAPAVKRPEPLRLVSSVTRSDSFDAAAALWISDHACSYPERLSTCPACGHHDCFKAMPENPARWYCFSSNHPDGVGIRGNHGYHGDALDLEAASRGCKPAEVLRRDGYYEVSSVSRVAQPVSADPLDDPEATRPGKRQALRRVWRNRSYATVVDILRTNAGDILDGRVPRYNTMAGRIELSGVPFTDNDVNVVRNRFETMFPGGQDSGGNETGMVQSTADIFAAFEQIARERSFHPVQDYLNSLTWDGEPRISRATTEIIRAEQTIINVAIVKRFLISAVARAMEPGCKVDTVLILVGGQGVHKTTLFRDLAGPKWFIDSRVNIESKDAYTTMRQAWIFEWGELDAIKRARDSESVKAFLSSQVDTYRPAYGRCDVQVPRSCVIVGSTNADEFLSDPTGNRRFWPLVVSGETNQVKLHEQRDQIWAEAVHLYRTHLRERHPVTHESPNQWWLNKEEELLIAEIHNQHFIEDDWTPIVVNWAENATGDITIPDLMLRALGVEPGRQSKSEQIRVASILRRNGWKKQLKAAGKKVWSR